MRSLVIPLLFSLSLSLQAAPAEVDWLDLLPPEDLAALDPANAARYRSNLAVFEQRMTQLDDQLRTRLAPLKSRPFFVFHETYDYFEAAYGLRHSGVFILGEVQLGARQVARLRERLREAGPTCVFYEPPQPPRLAQTLIEGLPVRLAPLDAQGYDLPVTGRAFEQLLENLGGQLASCLASAP